MDYIGIIKETAVQQLGVFSVIAVFLGLAWHRLDKRDKDERKEREEILKRQSEEAQKTQDLLINLVKENTATQAGLKNALDNNTRVMERVLDRFEEVMKNGK